MGNEVQDGISINNLSTNMYITRNGIELNFHVVVNITDEDEDVALTDATNIQAILTDIVKNFVSDYAEDGQEVD